MHSFANKAKSPSRGSNKMSGKMYETITTIPIVTDWYNQTMVTSKRQYSWYGIWHSIQVTG